MLISPASTRGLLLSCVHLLRLAAAGVPRLRRQPAPSGLEVAEQSRGPNREKLHCDQNGRRLDGGGSDHVLPTAGTGSAGPSRAANAICPCCQAFADAFLGTLTTPSATTRRSTRWTGCRSARALPGLAGELKIGMAIACLIWQPHGVDGVASDSHSGLDLVWQSPGDIEVCREGELRCPGCAQQTAAPLARASFADGTDAVGGRLASKEPPIIYLISGVGHKVFRVLGHRAQASTS